MALLMRQCIKLKWFLCSAVMVLCVGPAEAALLMSDQREQWEERGVSTELLYTIEYWDNVQGGNQEDNTYLGNLDFTLSLDTETLGWWDDGQFFVYFLDNHGGDKLTGTIIQDSQTVSNIEAPRTSRLYELWYEHMFMDEQWAVLLGIHDYNSEFAVTEYGSLFINSSFGISPEMTTAGRPSIFPLAAPAIRLKWMPDNQFEWLVGVYDGDPGDPEIDEHYPRSTIDDDQGLFLASEWIYHKPVATPDDGLPGTYKFGVWHNSGTFVDVVDTDVSGNAQRHRHNLGVYGIVDQMVYREHGDQGLSVFMQMGGSRESLNEINFYTGAGLYYKGFIPQRDDDELGLAVAYATISDDITTASNRDDAETVFELTYRWQMNDSMAIQPDVQYIINPGANPDLKDTVAVGVRFEMAL